MLNLEHGRLKLDLMCFISTLESLVTALIFLHHLKIGSN